MQRPSFLARPGHPLRPAFTLIELLVVMVISLILLAMAASAINVGVNSNLEGSGASQLQSLIMGARELALRDRAPRGLRLLKDPTNPRLISAAIFIEETEPWIGQVRIMRTDLAQPYHATANPLRRIRMRDLTQLPNFDSLTHNETGILPRNTSTGILTSPTRIRIPGNRLGTWYVVDRVSVVNGVVDLLITEPFRESPPDVSNPEIYNQAVLELPPMVMPGRKPNTLPNTVVVDLDSSGTDYNLALQSGFDQNSPAWMKPVRGTRIPQYWKVDDTTQMQRFSYINNLDLMFSPSGSMTGPAAASGLIHLLVTNLEAATAGVPPYYDPAVAATWPTAQPLAWPGIPAWTEPLVEKVPQRFSVTIMTRTGMVSTNPISPESLGGSPPVFDPFRYAERGEVASK